MNIKETNICVGGPLDGQGYQAPPGTRLFYYDERPDELRDPLSRPVPTAEQVRAQMDLKITRHTYILSQLAGETYVYLFWRHSYTSIDTLIERFLQNGVPQ